MRTARDEVLSDFLDAFKERPDAVEEYCKRYPEYRRDICECALMAAVLDDPDEGDDEAAIAERMETDPGFDEASRRLYAFMLEALAEQGRTTELERDGILGRLRRLGVKPLAAAEKLGIGLSVLTKIDRRLLHPETVPKRLISALGALLQVAVVEVQEYLNLPPTLSPTASYRSRWRPHLRSHGSEGHGVTRALYGRLLHYGASMRSEPAEVREMRRPASAEQVARQTFHEAVATAPDMSDPEKQPWLDEAGA